MKNLRLQHSSKKGFARTMVARQEGGGWSSCQNHNRNGSPTISHLLRTACGNHGLSRDAGVNPEGQQLGLPIRQFPQQEMQAAGVHGHHHSQKCEWVHSLLPSQAEGGLRSYIFNLSICTQPCFRTLHLQKTFSCSQTILQIMLSLIPIHTQVSMKSVPSKALLLSTF